MNYADAIRQPPKTLTEREQQLLLKVSGEHHAGFQDHVKNSPDTSPSSSPPSTPTPATKVTTNLKKQMQWPVIAVPKLKEPVHATMRQWESLPHGTSRLKRLRRD